jgi:hypothetical protein
VKESDYGSDVHTVKAEYERHQKEHKVIDQVSSQPPISGTNPRISAELELRIGVLHTQKNWSRITPGFVSF